MNLAEIDDLADVFSPWGLAGRCDVAAVATRSSPPDRPETQHWRGLSQMSQMSQGSTRKDAATPRADELALVAWTQADARGFLARHERLLRLGHAPDEAEAIAQTLTEAQRSGDDRRACIDCARFTPCRCASYRSAGLMTPQLSRDLASLLQRCPGFAANDEPELFLHEQEESKKESP